MKKSKKLITGMPKSEKVSGFAGKDMEKVQDYGNQVSRAGNDAVQKRRIKK